MDVYKSKIDKWLLICLILSMIACFLGASVMLKVGGAVNYVIATFMVAAGAGFPLWILITTKYILNDGILKIISGPFSWDITIDSIESVQETQEAITSPALSFDRLEIKYGEDKAILVSPINKKEFMQRLNKSKSTSNNNIDQQQMPKKRKKTTSNKRG